MNDGRKYKRVVSKRLILFYLKAVSDLQELAARQIGVAGNVVPNAMVYPGRLVLTIEVDCEALALRRRVVGILVSYVV